MITCQQILKALTEYLEGDLPPEEEREFEQHMQDCGSCHAFFRTYEKASELARQTLRENEIPKELQERVRNYLKKKLGLDS